jgi:hypothetical protein
MGRLGELPTGFLDGLVVTLYKAGPRTQPGNYRPITLLNSDYRVLAKVLATRLRAVQGGLIQPEQTGFLPGRHIGENIMLNQLLPAVLPPTSQALSVFLDFYKAYDTIIREFLYAVLQAFGLGAGFLMWVKLLLTNTGACTLINGYMSAKYAYTAGVRQGCPLAPELYLFVAQALLSFLKAKGFGVNVHGQHITASQLQMTPRCIFRLQPSSPASKQLWTRLRQPAVSGSTWPSPCFCLLAGALVWPSGHSTSVTSFSNNNLGCRPLSVESVAQQSAIVGLFGTHLCHLHRS